LLPGLQLLAMLLELQMLLAWLLLAKLLFMLLAELLLLQLRGLVLQLADLPELQLSLA
jgi:hypothetical protein